MRWIELFTAVITWTNHRLLELEISDELYQGFSKAVNSILHRFVICQTDKSGVDQTDWSPLTCSDYISKGFPRTEFANCCSGPVSMICSGEHRVPGMAVSPLWYCLSEAERCQVWIFWLISLIFLLKISLPQFACLLTCVSNVHALWN